MTSKYVKGVVKSTWTPLNHEDANLKVFEERRSLVNKWFDMWNTNQRKIILEDLLTNCTGNQVEYAKIILCTKAVQNHVDFTRVLPRVICLYIFSFLDPRSLCRASQVCWYWKYLAESNEMWAPKCARLGWYFSGPINTMEAGLWKKHFIENILYLQITRPAKDLTALEVAKNNEKEEALRKARKLKEKQRLLQKTSGAPWRGPDPKPIDIVRNNYIDNDIENGARVKDVHPRSGKKSRRLSAYETIINNKERSFVHPSNKNESQQSPPAIVSSVANTQLNEKLNSNLFVENIPRQIAQNFPVINNHEKLNFTPTLENNKNESHDCSDIPSGRPWILPNDLDEI